MEKKEKKKTISISLYVKGRLDDLKVHHRETYEEVLRRILDEPYEEKI